jgi:hypothetical protein
MKRLAEAHDLVVGAALGVEVRAALAAADRHAGQGVLEDLLEAEELDDPEVDARVEAQTALVGPERRVELHPEAAVDLHLALVVCHGTRKMIWRSGSQMRLRDRPLRVLGAGADHGGQARHDLEDGLMELRLTGIAREDHLEVRLDPGVEFRGHGPTLANLDRWCRAGSPSGRPAGVARGAREPVAHSAPAADLDRRCPSVPVATVAG